MKTLTKLFSNRRQTNDIKKCSGLTIIGTEKELNQIPLKVFALAHHIFERKSDGSLEVVKARSLS